MVDDTYTVSPPAAGHAAFVNVMMDYPNGTLVVGITRGSAVSSGQTLTLFQEVDEAYGTLFRGMSVYWSQLFIVTKGDPSSAIVHRVTSGGGPLHYAKELLPFPKGLYCDS